MKTLFLFENTDAETLFFFELDGDFSHLNEVYIGIHGGGEKVQELNNLVFDDEGSYLVTKLSQPTRDWDHFVKCGILS